MARNIVSSPLILSTCTQVTSLKQTCTYTCILYFSRSNQCRLIRIYPFSSHSNKKATTHIPKLSRSELIFHREFILKKAFIDYFTNFFHRTRLKNTFCLNTKSMRSHQLNIFDRWNNFIYDHVFLLYLLDNFNH